MKIPSIIIRVTAMLFLIAPLAMAADWPEWGGQPSRNMVSSEKGLPDWFDCGKENANDEVDMATTKNVKWVAGLGSKTCGSPVVSQGKVFIGTITAENAAGILCFDEQTGRELGKFVCSNPGKDGVVRCMEHWGVCSTPTVEGDRIYFVSPCQEVVCLDLNAWIGSEKSVSTNGNDRAASNKCIVWKYDLAKELNSVQDHVACCSVLVHDNFVYVCTGNGRFKTQNKPYSPLTPSLVVLNKKNGQIVARDDEQIGARLSRGQWSSPSMGMVDNKVQIYFGAGDGVCYAFEPADGNMAVPPDRWITTTQRGPIVQFIKFNSKNDDSVSSDSTAKNRPGPAVPSSPLPIETRYAVSLPTCSPTDSIPTAKVPDVPLLKKIWWFDCLPDEYKKAPYKADRRFIGKGIPCEIIATPVFYRNRVYLAIGNDPKEGGANFKGNLVCIDATKRGDITQTGQIWNYDKISQSISTIAIDGGLVYTLDQSYTMHCLDADTGQCYWTTKVAKGEPAYNSPLLADGKLFVGETILSAGKELKVLSSGLPVAECSSPCAANGVLFTVRDKRLWAICEKGDKKPLAQVVK